MFVCRSLAVFAALALIAGSCSGSGDAEPAPTSTSTSTSTSTTTTTTVSSETPTTTEAAAAPQSVYLCAATAQLPRAIVASEALPEVSGIVASRQHPGLIWAHNDSGGLAQLHLIDSDGAELGRWPFADTAAFDWEDMAVGLLPDGTSALFAADIGDNFSLRSDIRIYRVAEPTDLVPREPLEVATFTLSYPEGAQDAEALFVDPITGELIVITKGRDGDPIRIYTTPGDSLNAERIEMTLVGEVNLDGASPLTTAASITADGSVVAIRTYAEVLLWDRPADATLAASLAAAPCRAPVEAEAQGEAISFLPDGTGYVTISEGLNPLINVFIVG
jgi:hypothetical protein